MFFITNSCKSIVSPVESCIGISHTADTSRVESASSKNASKIYLTRNTGNNPEEYSRWKNIFEISRNKALEDHLSQETSKLKRAQAEGFWRQLKHMTKSNTSYQTESLWNDRKEILSGIVQNEHEMFEKFFEAKHVKQNEKDFDKSFFIETNSRYEDLRLNDFKCSKNY